MIGAASLHSSRITYQVSPCLRASVVSVLRRGHSMPLYHFSEEANIERFVPRPPRARPEVKPLVWALDEGHQPLYLVPRDCPRVCFWPVPSTTPEDFERFFAYVAGRMVIAIEADWLDRLRTTRLYRYVLPEGPFVPLDDPDAW